jgi:hypothetical protein
MNLLSRVGIDVRCRWDVGWVAVHAEDRGRKLSIDTRHAPGEAHCMSVLNKCCSDDPHAPLVYLALAPPAACA